MLFFFVCSSGMAGSGKTSLMQRVNAYLHQIKKPCYVVNLDPAVHQVPFETNIDIRDTVNYKEVMKQFGLGPNGGDIADILDYVSWDFCNALRCRHCD
jgi:GTPase SAR1 family protein